jgi:short-subunit dehydrogenase
MSKTIVITGATSGIGRALLNKYTCNNNRVIVVSRSASNLKYGDTSGFKLFAVDADLSKDSGIIYAVEELKKICSDCTCTIDILVNNSALNIPGYMVDLDIKQYDSLMNVNVKAPLFLISGLKNNITKNGRVLNIVSIAGKTVIPGLGVYCMSKTALYTQTNFMSYEMRNNFLVSGLIPGEADTNMQNALRAADKDLVPSAEFYRSNKQNLIPASIVAEFIFWVLNKTNDKEFVDNTWYIYDKKYHKDWMPNGEAFTYVIPEFPEYS